MLYRTTLVLISEIEIANSVRERICISKGLDRLR